MRWIDLSKYSPKPEWLKKAKQVTELLKAASSRKKRKEIIDDNCDLWKEIKKELLKLSNDKCWYTEAKELVSHYHVDHFRPKNNVKLFKRGNIETVNIDEGYWWLAFDWTNYRIAGAMSNSANADEGSNCRGKQDYFPIRKGCNCADKPECDLNQEMYAILDPTIEEDTMLIAFDETGMPYSTAPKDSWESQRVEITIYLLHLDSPQLVDERKKIWNKCKRLMHEYANIMCKRGELSEELIENRRKNILVELKELTSRESQLSTAAISCLLESEYPWAKRIALSA